MVHGAGEPPAKNAQELLAFLTNGSPIARLVFQELLAIKALEPLEKARYGHYQKLIIGETYPANAFFLQALLRCALVDARVFHADLSHQGKSQLVDLFNDPTSSLKVLIMMYEVGAVGLNLHIACNRVLIASVARSRGQESQLAGRALRITSEFPLTVVRCLVPNSHDQFRSARQADKATLQLAANANDPAIRTLIVDLLNEFQPQVDQCHANEAAQELLREVNERQQIYEIELGAHLEESRRAHAEGRAETEASREVLHLLDAAAPQPLRSQRSRKHPERFSHTNYDDQGFLLDSETRQEQHQQLEEEWLLSSSESEPEANVLDEDYQDSAISGDDQDDSVELEANFAALREREEAIQAKEELEFIKSHMLAQFVVEEQPDDETRHQLAILSLPPSKVWTDADLNDEGTMRVGLLLLYNKIHGRSHLHIPCVTEYPSLVRFPNPGHC